MIIFSPEDTLEFTLTPPTATIWGIVNGVPRIDSSKFKVLTLIN